MLQNEGKNHTVEKLRVKSPIAFKTGARMLKSLDKYKTKFKILVTRLPP